MLLKPYEIESILQVSELPQKPSEGLNSLVL